MKRNRGNILAGYPVEVSGLTVEVRHDNIDIALRKLKKLAVSERLLEVRDRKHYTTNSERKRIAKKKAVQRTKIAVRKDKMPKY